MCGAINERVRTIEAFNRDRVALQFAVAGGAPDLGIDTEVAAQQLRCGEYLAQDRARPQQPHIGRSARGAIRYRPLSTSAATPSGSKGWASFSFISSR